MKKDPIVACEPPPTIGIFLENSSDKYLLHSYGGYHELVVTFSDSIGVNTTYIADSLCRAFSDPCFRSSYTNYAAYIIFRDTLTNTPTWTPRFGHVFYTQQCQ